MNKTCDSCGEILVRKSGERPLHFAERRFCDKACKYNAQRRIAVSKAGTCGHCGEALQQRDGESNFNFRRRRFCNGACANRARPSPRRTHVTAGVCHSCGKTLKRKEHEKLNDFLRRRYCDRRCAGKARWTPPANETAFDELTPEACYWIGFLFADGCIWRAKHGQPTVTLTLACKDSAHIEKFRAFLGIQTAIYIRPSHYTSNGYFSSDQVTTSACSQYLADRLVSYGFQKNPRWPTAPELVNSRDFWRGVIDGDGSVTMTKSKNLPIVSLVGYRELLVQFASFLRLHCPNAPATLQPNGVIFDVRTTTASDALTMLKVLYEGCTVALDRKHAAAMGYLANPPTPIGSPRTMRFKKREVAERYLDGESGVQLAEAYETSPSTILRILDSLGIPRRSMSEAQKDRFKRERESESR